MSHEVETMAFANEVPWHGLGNRVDPSVGVDEMLVAAGLNWEVKLHPMHAELPGGAGSVRVPNKSALLRSTDNKVLTVASDQWKPVQNREVLEFFRAYTEAGGAKLETAGSLRGGRTIWALANLGHGFTVANGDAIKGYILLASHHEHGKATIAKATQIRVVCANTMALAMGRGSKAPVYKQSHLTEFDAQAARETLGVAHESMVEAEKNAKILLGLKVSEEDAVRVLAKHVQPSFEVEDLVLKPEIRNQKLHDLLLCDTQAPGAMPGTGWGLMNAVTYWADHVAGREAGARMQNSWFGTTGELKLEVEKDLLQMAA